MDRKFKTNYKIRKVLCLLFVFFLYFQIIGQNIKNLDSLLQRATLSRNDTVKIELLNRIARIYIYISDNESSLKFAKEALSLSKEVNWKKGEANALDVIGHNNFYGEQGLPEASKYYHEALKIREEINDTIGLSVSYNNLGNFKMIQSDFKSAELYYLQNLNLIRNMIDSQLIKSYGNLGGIYKKRGLYELAIAYFDSSIYCTDGAIYPINLSNDILRKGQVLGLLGITDSIIPYYNKALKLRKITCDTIGIIYINNLITEQLIKNNDLKNAEKLIKEIECFLTLNKTLPNWLFTLRNKVDICEKTGDYKCGFILQKEILTLKDSIMPLENFKKISEVEFDYILHKNKQINEYKNQQRKIKYITSTLVLTLIIVLVFSLYFIQKNHTKAAKFEKENLYLQKFKLESEIDQGQKELVTNAMRLVEKTETINDVIDKLKNASTKFKVENREIINKIIADLKRNTSDNFWETFECSFSKIHKDFYSNLETHHPGLSPAEKRLSAFLRLKLNTKDIAYLTHLTTGSIETSRIRLRKKFGLSHQNVNLYSYISQF